MVGNQVVGLGWKQVPEQGELGQDGLSVEQEAVHGDQHGHRGKDGERTVEGAAGGDEGDAVGQHLDEGAPDDDAPAGPGDLGRGVGEAAEFAGVGLP